MIKYKDQISLRKTPVFTSISLAPPLQESLNLPADACYLYIAQGTGHSLLKPRNIRGRETHTLGRIGELCNDQIRLGKIV